MGGSGNGGGVSGCGMRCVQSYTSGSMGQTDFRRAMFRYGCCTASEKGPPRLHALEINTG